MKTLSFTIDNFKILEDDPYITLLELYVVSEGINLNNTYFSLETIEDGIPTISNKPIICIWDTLRNDFKEHARNFIDFKQQDCVGCIPESNNAEIVEFQDKKFLKVNCCIWKHYFPEIAEKLKSNNETKISMEVEILEDHEMEDGVLQIDKMRFLAVSLLGSNKTPGIEFANAKIIKYSTDEYEEMITETNKKLSMFSIPEIVKENAKKALENKPKNPQLINFAKEIVKNKEFSYSKINYIYEKIKNIRKPENLEFYGGKESKEWCENIILKDNNANKKEVKKHINFIKDKENSIKNKNNNKNEKIRKEVFGLNFYDIMRILNSLLEGYACDEYGCPKFMLDGADENFVYAVCYCEYPTQYFKIPYTKGEGDTFVINYEAAVQCFPVTNYVDIAPTQEVKGVMDFSCEGIHEYFVKNSNKTKDLETKYNETIKKYSNIDKKYSTLTKDLENKNKELADKDIEISKFTEELSSKNEMLTNKDTEIVNKDGEIAKFTEELTSLKKYQEDKIKEERTNDAEKLYSKYNSYISDEDKKSLNEKLFTYDNFEDFKKEVFSIVTPKIEAENEALKQQKPTDNGKHIDYTIMPLVNKDQNKNTKKSSIESLKDYINS